MQSMSNALVQEQRKQHNKPIVKLEVYDFDYPARQTFSHTLFDWTQVYPEEDVDILEHDACMTYDGHILRFRIQTEGGDFAGVDDYLTLHWQRITNPDIDITEETARGALTGSVRYAGSAAGANTVVYTKSPCLVSGTVDSVYIRSPGTANVKVAIYSDNAGSPGTRLVYNNESQAIAIGLNVVALDDELEVTADTVYWVAVAGSANFTVPGLNMGAAYSHAKSITYATYEFPASADTGMTPDNYTRALNGYGTYTTDWDVWTPLLDTKCLVDIHGMTCAASPVDGEVLLWYNEDTVLKMLKSTDNGETWGSSIFGEIVDFKTLTGSASGLTLSKGHAKYNSDGDICFVYGLLSLALRTDGAWSVVTGEDLTPGVITYTDCHWDSTDEVWWILFLYDSTGSSDTYYLTTIVYDPSAAPGSRWGADWTVSVLTTSDHSTSWADIEPLKFNNNTLQEAEAHKLAYMSDRFNGTMLGNLNLGGFVSTEAGKLGLQQSALFDINSYWGQRYNLFKGAKATGSYPMVGANQTGSTGCGRNFPVMTSSWYALGGASNYWANAYKGMHGISMARSSAGLINKTQAWYYTTYNGLALIDLPDIGLVASIYTDSDIHCYIHKPDSGWEPATFSKAYRLNLAASRGIRFMYNAGRTDDYLWASTPDYVLRCSMPKWWSTPTAGDGIGETPLEITDGIYEIQEVVNVRQGSLVVTLDNSAHEYDDAGTGDYAYLQKGNIVYLYTGFNIDGVETWHNSSRYVIGDISFEREPGYAYCTLNCVDGWHLAQKVLISRPYVWNEFSEDSTALEILEMLVEAIGGTLNVTSYSDLINTMYPRFEGASGSTVAELINRILTMCPEDKIYWYGMDCYLVNPQTTDSSVYSYTFPTVNVG